MDLEVLVYESYVRCRYFYGSHLSLLHLNLKKDELNCVGTRARAHARCGARRGAKRRRSSTPAREKRSRVSGVSVPMENGLGDSRVDGSHAGGGRRKTKTTPRDVLVGGLGPGCGPGRGPGR